MTRLQAEQRRLYVHQDTGGGVRALLLQVKQPAGWDTLSRVWQGVQGDLALPAPAIAVSGGDAYQLWFSLAQPVDGSRATAFLQHLRVRYLHDVPPGQIRAEALDTNTSASVPPSKVDNERWSAFVTPDLVTLFTEERWLDHPPGDEAQADLLSRIEAMKAEAFLRAEEQLGREETAPTEAGTEVRPEGDAQSVDPRRFLLSVMQDASAPLHLRIEAAKALLPGTAGERPRREGPSRAPTHQR